MTSQHQRHQSPSPTSPQLDPRHPRQPQQRLRKPQPPRQGNPMQRPKRPLRFAYRLLNQKNLVETNSPHIQPKPLTEMATATGTTTTATATGTAATATGAAAMTAGLVRQNIQKHKLATVCQEAQCPNLGHCWAQGTATYLIMGTNCTRRCGFCHISTARPTPLNRNEPQELAQSVVDLGLKYVVITSVDRDDLRDCGSRHFAECVRAVQAKNRSIKIETLIPDFKGCIENLLHIWQAMPLVINHNVETVPSLYPSICPQSNYQHSLLVLRWSSLQGFLTKSGIILGLGETVGQVRQVIQDLVNNGVQILTMGQYLQPSPQHAPCKEYVSEEVFAELKDFALSAGMGYVESGPLVRSSFHASSTFDAFLREKSLSKS